MWLKTMQERRYIVVGRYEWRQDYEAAMLETDRARLAQRIKIAQAKIGARAEELRCDREATGDEREAITDAMTALSVLRREIQQDGKSH